ncbi:MAG TPA: hypothetical protein VH083_25835, partial [Myxococcales bacterium]|nr:hypothetical protein [Myxococcales bacterium]
MNLFQRVAVALAVACLSAACSTTGSEPIACATGQIACGTTCVSPITDVNNCGGCGNVCAAPTGGTVACNLGQCQVACAAGQITCGGADAGQALTCATLDTDRANCGGCGTACGSTEVCGDSRCAPCPIAQCNNVCTDTQHDAANCGACGTACAAGQACLNGACGAPITITLLPPADGGFVSLTSQVEVAVNSQFRIRNVTVDGPPVGQLPDGGLITHSDLEILGNFDQNTTDWAFLVGNILQ